jgi:hypothetical protein
MAAGGGLLRCAVGARHGLGVFPRAGLPNLAARGGYDFAGHYSVSFLNSQIIGDRIKNLVWLTLIGLLVSEPLMDIEGIILAPVLLHYLKVEASQIEARPAEIYTTTRNANP